MPEENLAPKEVRAYAHGRENRVFVGSVWLKDNPGALASASAALASAGVNLIGSSSVSIKGTGEAEWGFFGEFRDPAVDADELKRLLGALPSVTKCIVKAETQGIVVDSLHYPLQFTSGQKAMVVRREVFADMLKHIKDVFGSGGATIALELGMKAGEDDAREIIREFGKDVMVGNMGEVMMLYLALGWGRPQLVDFSTNPRSMTLRLYDNFECVGQSSKTTNSHFVRGHLMGGGSVVFGTKAEVKEVRCIARGDEYCEFYTTVSGT